MVNGLKNIFDLLSAKGKKLLSAAALSAVILSSPAVALADGYGGYGGWGGGMMGGFGQGIFGGFFMFFFWIIIIIAVVLVIRYATRSGHDKGSGGASSRTALDILKERYARGEISRDEFNRMKDEINSSS